ncbi:serine hydrolase-domain-containing protein [Armillaria novae-zelandiae]|uniref:Serine hydrolase-domain-containing protein n=1 Tax=Armillaria novae-zelandiae TaxID=153914 RepID=A0AA39PP94_9AGAR|nr:serine hydrolase-domain-containing protein [Armillaria novae-zelandiae]
MSSIEKRRILMLHGYGQSAYLMSRLLASTIKECANDNIEFLFLDAPWVMTPADPSGAVAVANSEISAPVCSTPTASPEGPGVPRRWFTIHNFGGNTMPGIEASLDLLRETLQNNRFEAIFGFSQGAAMAELIAAMVCGVMHWSDRISIRRSALTALHLTHLCKKYLVTIAGFLLRGPLASWGGRSKNVFHQDTGAFPLRTPILHVLGQVDLVVPRERANIFMGFHESKRVEQHVGGHFIPTRPKWRKFFAKFLNDPFGDIASPTLVKECVTVTPPPSAHLPETRYRMGQSLPQGYLSEEEERRSGASTPDSEPPQTPTFEPTLLPLPSAKEDARMWDVYTGLVYQG